MAVYFGQQEASSGKLYSRLLVIGTNDVTTAKKYHSENSRR